MSAKVVANPWCELLHDQSEGILEMRWLPSEMTDAAFKASVALLAWEAEKLRPRFVLIDATEFHFRPGAGMMQWRDDSIIPRYGAAGVTKFALLMPAGVPNTMEQGGKETIDGPAIFPTAWFSRRESALAWFRKH